MDLHEEIMQHMLREEWVEKVLREAVEKIEVSPFWEVLLKARCYEALEKIRAVLIDDTLDDPECFMRIEEIVRIFEDLGCGAGGRHEF